MEVQDIDGAVSAIMEALTSQGKSPETIKDYKNSFNAFMRYLADNQIPWINEEICLEYISLKTGKRIESFECVVADSRVNYRMRPLLLLLHYLADGQIHQGARRTKPQFVCPTCFAPEYEAFCEELIYRNYAQATIDQNIQKVQLLLVYLAEHGVDPINITILHIEGYLKTLERYSVKYIGTFLYVFRNFLNFLYDYGFIESDLASQLPKVRSPRNATVPYVWSKKDLQNYSVLSTAPIPRGSATMRYFCLQSISGFVSVISGV